MKQTTLIVEDHPLYRDALQTLASLLFPEDEVVPACSAEQGLQAAGNAPLRLVILDFSLRGMSGSAAITLYRQRFPGVPLLVISASEDRQLACAALRAGAVAFVSKALPMAQMQELIQRAAAGRITHGEWHFPDDHGTHEPATLPAMPQRQREILALVCHGFTNKEIALRLALAEVTVKMHLTHAFRTLGVVNRSQAIRAIHSLGVELAQRQAPA